MVFDFYTSMDMSKEEFEKIVITACLRAEQIMNARGNIRVHVKETQRKPS